MSAAFKQKMCLYIAGFFLEAANVQPKVIIKNQDAVSRQRLKLYITLLLDELKKALLQSDDADVRAYAAKVQYPDAAAITNAFAAYGAEDGSPWDPFLNPKTAADAIVNQFIDSIPINAFREEKIDEVTKDISDKTKSAYNSLVPILNSCTEGVATGQTVYCTSQDALVTRIRDIIKAQNKEVSNVLIPVDGGLYAEEADITNIFTVLGGNTTTPVPIVVDEFTVVYTPSTTNTSASISFKKGDDKIIIDEIIKSVVLGETPEKPGLNADGVTMPDDFRFGDSPTNSIINDPLFTKSNAELIIKFKDMVEFVSTAPLENVLKDMIARFSNGSGGTFNSQTLNDAVHGANEYDTYYKNQLQQIQNIAGGMSINTLKNFPKLTLNRLSFPSFTSILDKNILPTNGLINGLVIAIHQVWAAKVEFKNVLLNKNSKTGKATMVFTLYDHFGLDAEDIIKFGNTPIVGDGFKAWYILQHYRNAKPFVTEVKISYPINILFE